MTADQSVPHCGASALHPSSTDALPISRYPPRVVRFFATVTLALAVGTAAASASARPKHHHRHAKAHHHHHYAKSKASKAKTKDKTKASAEDSGKAEHDVKEPGKAKGAKGSKATGGTPKVVETGKEGKGKEAIKTYKFGPQEVEGRLKSPEIIYFLRRVRAEFAAGDLGHRSFMRELSDTRRDPAFR